MSRTACLIAVGGAYVLCAPLLDGFLVDNSLVPQRVDGLLGLLREIVSQQILEIVQFFLNYCAFRC